MTYAEYLKEVAREKAAKPHLRYGQAAFNVFAEIKPEVAQKIVATDADPFYNNENLSRFMSVAYKAFEEK